MNLEGYAAAGGQMRGHRFEGRGPSILRWGWLDDDTFHGVYDGHEFIAKFDRRDSIKLRWLT